MNKKPLMTVGCEELDDSDNENQSQYMKDDVVYNRPENIVMVRSQGNKIVVVCKDEDFVTENNPCNTFPKSCGQ